MIFPLTCHFWSVSSARLAVTKPMRYMHPTKRTTAQKSTPQRGDIGSKTEMRSVWPWDLRTTDWFFRENWNRKAPYGPYLIGTSIVLRCSQTNQAIEDGPKTKNKTLSKSRYLKLEVGKLQPQMSRNQKLGTHHRSMMPSKGQGYFGSVCFFNSAVSLHPAEYSGVASAQNQPSTGQLKRGKWADPKRCYHLVMTNSLPWKDPPIFNR